jgi:alpha-1,3-glucosyltransferase
VLSNAGLLMVDHVHFQYNGFLTGVLLLSLAALARDQVLQAAVWFSILLNLKHIYMYYAPAVGVYMLRSHCFQSARDGAILWRSFSPLRLVSLGGAVLATTGLSLGPFRHQLPQLLARLFPFRRGLCHAYWAPNAWAVYNLADKALAVAWRRLGWTVAGGPASMTAGLVQDIQHAVLPSVPPLATALLTLAAMLPALGKLWLAPHSLTQFLRCLTLCAWSCFLLGWHVHEKAVLLVLVPLAVLAVGSRQEARLYLVTATTGHFSLFPLLFQPRELPTKVLLHLSHWLLAGHLLPHAAPLHLLERSYLALALPLFLYCEMLQPWLGLQASLPFLPLLLYSLYCSIGIITSYFRFYAHFLRS